MREGFARAFLDENFIALDELLQGFDGKIRIELGVKFAFEYFHNLVEGVGFGFVAGLDTHYDIAVHLDKSAVASPMQNADFAFLQPILRRFYR